jgi:(heptosyl)LPS beta-1,4-glucosyltransferase
VTRRMHLTAVILARDEEQNIAQCIASLEWADRVVVILDSRTTDRTGEIAHYMGAAVYPRPFRDYADQRNAALRIVRSDWVLFVDADERVRRELASEIRRAMEDDSKAGWWVPRHNYIFGRIIRHTGWYPDYQLRLLRRGHAQYDPERPVHELVILDGEAGYLQNPLIHYNYRTLTEFRDRQQRYAAFEASALLKEGVRPRWQDFVLQPLREFRRRYMTLRGYRDGAHGLVLSLLMAWYTLQRYRMLRALWQAQD